MVDLQDEERQALMRRKSREAAAAALKNSEVGETLVLDFLNDISLSNSDAGRYYETRKSVEIHSLRR